MITPLTILNQRNLIVYHILSKLLSYPIHPEHFYKIKRTCLECPPTYPSKPWRSRKLEERRALFDLFNKKFKIEGSVKIDKLKGVYR